MTHITRHIRNNSCFFFSYVLMVDPSNFHRTGEKIEWCFFQCCYETIKTFWIKFCLICKACTYARGSKRAPPRHAGLYEKPFEQARLLFSLFPDLTFFGISHFLILSPSLSLSLRSPLSHINSFSFPFSFFPLSLLLRRRTRSQQSGRSVDKRRERKTQAELARERKEREREREKWTKQSHIFVAAAAIGKRTSFTLQLHP